LTLDPQEIPFPWDDYAQVKWEAAPKRNQHLDSSGRQLVKHGSLSRVASVNRVHMCRVTLAPDEHMFDLPTR
jgi:hypothetical protein